MPAITGYPWPPVHGESLSLSTDGTLPKTLKIQFAGKPKPPDMTVELVEAKENMTVPASASSISVHDESFECPDINSVVG